MSKINFLMARENARDLLALLTPREAEIVEIMALGVPRHEICVRLTITRKTLEVHVKRIVDKLKMPPNGWGRIWFCALCGE